MLTVKNIHHSFSEKDVLKGISFNINAGEYVALIGPNGSGKSTLVKLLSNIHNLQKGEIWLKSRTLKSLNRSAIAQNIAYVPQQVQMDFNFPVHQVVAMGRFAHTGTMHVQTDEERKIVDLALEQMHLSHLKQRPFSALSGGEQQRVIIASAIAQQSKLLLLDEPTSALDLRHQQDIYLHLKEQCHHYGKTVVIVTHDINLAAQYCDRIMLLHNGQLIKDGAPKDVLEFNTIQQVYNVKVYIDINPLNDALYVLPYK